MCKVAIFELKYSFYCENLGFFGFLRSKILTFFVLDSTRGRCS